MKGNQWAKLLRLLRLPEVVRRDLDPTPDQWQRELNRKERNPLPTSQTITMSSRWLSQEDERIRRQQFPAHLFHLSGDWWQGDLRPRFHLNLLPLLWGLPPPLLLQRIKQLMQPRLLRWWNLPPFPYAFDLPLLPSVRHPQTVNRRRGRDIFLSTHNRPRQNRRALTHPVLKRPRKTRHLLPLRVELLFAILMTLSSSVMDDQSEGQLEMLVTETERHQQLSFQQFLGRTVHAILALSVGKTMPLLPTFRDTSRHIEASTLNWQRNVQLVIRFTSRCLLLRCTFWPTTWHTRVRFVESHFLVHGSFRDTWDLTQERSHSAALTVARHLLTVPIWGHTCRLIPLSRTTSARGVISLLPSSPTSTNITSHLVFVTQMPDQQEDHLPLPRPSGPSRRLLHH